MRDDGDYHHLLASLWADRRDFAVVEHDIGINAGVLPQFRDCSSAWCAFSYSGPGAMVSALGCVRFRARLMAAEPHLFDEIARIDDAADVPPMHWSRLDVRLADALYRRGWIRCVHGTVRHYHRY